MGRFIAAIVVFAVALVFLTTGIAFKISSGPRTITEKVRIPDTATYAVIDASVLSAHPGVQSVIVSGATTNMVAYGRTIDVQSWIGTSPYLNVSRTKTGKVVAKRVMSTVDPEAVAATIVNPDGSDMWLEHDSGVASASLSTILPPDMSIIVSGDGTEPVPSSLVFVWPLASPTFLFLQDDQLMFLGGGITLVGIALLFSAVSHYRRKQGPRRRTPKPPKPRKIARSRHGGIPSVPARGRRASQRRAMIAIPLALVVGFSLASCTSPYQTGQQADTPTPTKTTDSQGLDLPPVVVTEPQMRVIMQNIATLAAQADTNLDGNAAATRFAENALEARRANYALRKVDGAIPPIAAVPDFAPSLFLPEATNTWPRSILAVFQPRNTDPNAEKAPTTAMILQQNSPRENYLILYQLSLQASQTVPEVAAADLGAVRVAADSKLLVLPPESLAAAYADVIAKGDNSAFAELFDSAGDALRPALQAERAQQAADNVAVSYSDSAGAGSVIALASATSGAIVAVSVDENARFEPQGGRSLKLTGNLKALAGTELSPKPVNATYQIQLLFFVPAVGSDQKITLLGYSENLTKVAME